MMPVLNSISKWVLAAMGFFLVSCQSVYVTGPVPSVDSPEVRASNTIRFELGAKSGGSVMISSNAGSRPPDVGDGSMTSAYYLYGNAGISASPKIFLKGGLFGPLLWPTGGFIKAQWQLLGQDQADSQKGDHSLSLIADGLVQSMTYSGDQEYFGGPGHRNWSALGQMQGSTLALSYGYRASLTDLYFIGAGYGTFTTGGNIHQDATDSNAGGNYSIPSRNGTTSSFAIGWDGQSGSSNFILRALYYRITQDSQTMDRVGLDFSTSFGGNTRERKQPSPPSFKN